MKLTQAKSQDDLTPVRRLPRRKIKYTRVTNAQRHELIRLLVYCGCNISKAAEQSGINYENAKLIYRIYRQEGRVMKTPTNIKRFVKKLKCSQDELRSKLGPEAFNELKKEWDRVWIDGTSIHPVPMLPTLSDITE